MKIIADSSCDTTEELREQLDIEFAPLTIRVANGNEYVDVPELDTVALMEELKAHKEPARSNCPSPEDFAKIMRKHLESFVITLSSALSGTYGSAVVAKDMVLTESPEKKIHIFDSKSAASGETLIAMEINRLIKQNCSYETIVAGVEAFISRMQTIFVLESLENLVKNGRVSRIKASAASILNTFPIMCASDKGEIDVMCKVRGFQQTLNKLVSVIAEKTDDLKPNSVNLVLAYCNCSERAEALKKDILERCKAIKQVTLTPTGGLSSMYAYEGGIVIAFA